MQKYINRLLITDIITIKQIIKPISIRKIAHKL